MNEVYIKKLSFLQGVLKDRSGFTLPEVMIASLILGGVAVAMFQLTKDQVSTKVKSEITSDLAQFRSVVQTLYMNPAHCNANLIGRAVGSNVVVAAPQGVRRCNTGASCNIGATYVTAYPIYTTDWNAANTKISSKIRLKSVTYNVKATEVVAPTISEATVTLVLDVVQDIAKSAQYNPSLPPTYRVQSETMSFAVPVVITNRTTLSGCPKAWNSTFVYGAP